MTATCSRMLWSQEQCKPFPCDRPALFLVKEYAFSDPIYVCREHLPKSPYLMAPLRRDRETE